MSIEPGLISGIAFGLAVGAMAYFWKRKVEMEHRREFLNYVGNDLETAFLAAKDLLSLSDTPPTVRQNILLLLETFSSEQRAEHFRTAFLASGDRKPEKLSQDNALGRAMMELGQRNGKLAEKAHNVLASLYIGLIVVNFADHMKIEKVQDEAARKPSSLWSWIERMFSGYDDDSGISKGNLGHA